MSQKLSRQERIQCCMAFAEIESKTGCQKIGNWRQILAGVIDEIIALEKPVMIDADFPEVNEDLSDVSDALLAEIKVPKK